MTGEDWLPWANLGALAFSVIINVWIFIRTRSDDRWDSVQLQHQRFDARLSVLEVRVEALPTQDDLSDIQAHLGHIDKATAGLDERSNLTLKSVQRIERYLMERKT